MSHSPGSASWILNSFGVTNLDISSCEMSAVAVGNDGTSAETGGLRLVSGMDIDVDASSEGVV